MVSVRICPSCSGADIVAVLPGGGFQQGPQAMFSDKLAWDYWSDNLAIGIEAIDNDHRRILDTIASLRGAVDMEDAQPVIQQVDGADVVKIESRFLATTDEVGKSLGLDTIATNAANTLQHGEVWVADEQASVWSKLDAASGSDFVEMRAITVPSSGSGAIQCGTLQLKVSPVVSADHSNMDFEVRLEQPQTPAPVETKADAGAVQ